MAEGYVQKTYQGPVKRYCQTMDLKDDAELIRRYVEAHDALHFRPQVLEGIKSVGILEMELYLLGNRVFMIVETPLDFDWDTSMAKLAKLPGQEDWEAYVAMFQQCNPNDTSDEKWKMMERVFHIYE